MAQEIADSKLLDTWGSSGRKIEPDITKIIEGWQLGEQPPHEYMNWLQNTFGSKLNHILKNGVASWNNTTQYLAGSSVQHNGNVWICKTTNTNSEPTGLNANWEKVAINKDLTVTVDTLADLRNISYPANTVWASGYDTKNDGAFGSHIFRLKGVKTTETDNSGTIIIATIGGTDYVYELQFDGAVNVKWFGAKGDGITDDTVAVQKVINFCKQSGNYLYVDKGTYNADFTFSWLVPLSVKILIENDISYDTSNIHQGVVGLNFNIEFHSDAVVMGDVHFDRLRNCSVSGGTFKGNVILTSVQKTSFKDISCSGIGSMAYNSDNPADEPLQVKKWFLNLTTEYSDGGCYWTTWTNCSFKGFVLGGNGLASHNVHTFTNCLLTGAKAVDVATNPPYLNHKGAGLYSNMISGHTDGIILNGCDLSYNDFPLWNVNSNPISCVGVYYEACTNNFYTSNGATSSHSACTILNGFDYDRDINTRIGLRATRWKLQGNLGSSDNYAGFQIPAYGGSVGFEDSSIGNMGGIINRSDNSDYGKGMGLSLSSKEGSVVQNTVSIGHRIQRNWHTTSLMKKVYLAASASTTFRFIPISTAPAFIDGNAEIIINVVGGVSNNSASRPISATVWAEVSSSVWGVTTTTSGNLVGGRLTAVFSSSGNNLLCTLTNTSSGNFYGSIKLSGSIDTYQKDTSSNNLYWVIYNY